MKRVYVCLSAFAAAACAAGSLSAQAPGGAPATSGTAPPAASRGVAVFNVAKVMKEYQKWQYYAATMNKERVARAAELAGLRDKAMKLEAENRTETVPAKKTEREQQLIVLQRQFEDTQKSIQKDIDEKSATHLRVLFGEIRNVVDAVAKTNGFDLVMAYPDAITPEEMNSPLYFELKLRPSAAMPFYVSPNVDISAVVVATLNKHYPAPGPIEPATPGVTPTGGVPPGTPVATPPAGSPPPMK